MEIHGYQLTFDAVDHLIKANMSIDKTGGKGTCKGRPNYKSSILLKVVRSILPASKLGWEEVADNYKLSTKEEVIFFLCTEQMLLQTCYKREFAILRFHPFTE